MPQTPVESARELELVGKYVSHVFAPTMPALSQDERVELSELMEEVPAPAPTPAA